MMPKHCKEVGLKEVAFDLTSDSIKNNLIGSKFYTRTRYLIIKKDESFAVVELKKTNKKALFNEVTELDVISLPEDTIFIDDPSVDVLNPTSLAHAAINNPGKTLIVKGKFEHISFVKDPEIIELNIIDIVPPIPSRLSELIESVISCGLIESPIESKEKIIDLNALVRDYENRLVIFPCFASGLEHGNKTYFLDKYPELKEDEIENLVLIGCELSKRIFTELYGRAPEFINICPKEHQEGLPRGAYILARCCKVKEGYKIENNIALVPWGATALEVSNAVNALLLK
jgi:hypothetical protein